MILGRFKTIDEYVKENQDKPWFAWHPVILESGELVWLRRIRRSVRIVPDLGGDFTLKWTYRGSDV